MEKIEFTRDLIEWYWQHGSKRTDDYAIPTSSWLKKLYDTEKQLTAIAETRANTRPSMAVWGPSQTGKSTLVSAYVDKNARYEKREDVDGEGSGLHWPGGSRAFFMAPEIDSPLYMNRMVLNPFNHGWDGSSCLSRFVSGSTKVGEAPYLVKDVQHPIEIRLIPEVDLLQVVARGYDSECLGASRTGAATNWTMSEFESRLAKFKRKQTPSNKAPSRTAYEALHDLCMVLADLVFAELPRYRALLEQGEENWHAQLASLLAEPVLLSNPDIVDAFAGEILWDGSSVLQDYYLKMRNHLRTLKQAAGRRQIFCSLDAAIIMLNMAACTIYFGEPPSPDTKEGVIFPIITKLGFRLEDDRMLMGCGASYTQRLATSPEHFAFVQGLIWELIIPLNQDNLPESSFKDFLRYSDLLDFAGVGNEPKGDVTRLIVHSNAEAQANSDGVTKGVPFTPLSFFSKIVKRGKTACIVSTYAKRMSVDGFNVFQNVDGFPAVNAQQLINGIESWWKYLLPEYYRLGGGRSPMPLNLGLMWWAKGINQGIGNPKGVFPAMLPTIEALGRIGDPNVANTFAFNYFKFPRGRLIEEAPKDIFDRIASAPEFRKQFNNPTSEQSYKEMARDEATGGTSYFFVTIKKQLEAARSNPASNRISIMEARIGTLETGLIDLLSAPKLFPPVKVVDVRKEQLERFRNGFIEAIKGKSEKQMREINQALREFLDVPYQVLLTPPADEAEVNRPFVARQFRQWIDAQVGRFDQWDRNGRKGRPDWALLGLTTRESFNDTLEALRASVEPRLDDIATWLSRLVVQSKQANSDLRNTQLRRHLAVRMCNEIVSSNTAELEFPEMEAESGDEESISPPIGRECLNYHAFIRPFIEGQIAAFISMRLTPIKRPDQPGDPELSALCDRHNLRPD